MEATWSGASPGRMPSTSAAAAVTIGAENDVPSAWRNSNGPQSEYPCSTQTLPVGFVTLNGRVEKMSEPGAEMSLYRVSRSENSGTLPVESRALAHAEHAVAAASGPGEVPR